MCFIAIERPILDLKLDSQQQWCLKFLCGHNAAPGREMRAAINNGKLIPEQIFGPTFYGLMASLVRLDLVSRWPIKSSNERERATWFQITQKGKEAANAAKD